MDDNTYDCKNLEGLRKALRENHSFGVGTEPGRPMDKNLTASLLRLEDKGLVRRTVNEPDSIWWQAVE